MNTNKLTPEEKEVLRNIMEDEEACKQLGGFDGMNWEVPPPEFFMRGEPESRYQWMIYVAAGVFGAIAMKNFLCFFWRVKKKR